MNSPNSLLVRFVELLLGVAGGVLVALVYVAASRDGADPWRSVALAACVAMLLNGGVSYWVRRRQRLARMLLLRQMKVMLARCGVEEMKQHPEVEKLVGKRMSVAIQFAKNQIETLAGEPLQNPQRQHRRQLNSL